MQLFKGFICASPVTYQLSFTLESLLVYPSQVSSVQLVKDFATINQFHFKVLCFSTSTLKWYFWSIQHDSYHLLLNFYLRRHFWRFILNLLYFCRLVLSVHESSLRTVISIDNRHWIWVLLSFLLLKSCLMMLSYSNYTRVRAPIDCRNNYWNQVFSRYRFHLRLYL